MTGEPSKHALPEIEITQRLSQLGDLDAMTARVDGVINLITKVHRAVERAGTGDRDRALALVRRAEALLDEARELPGDTSEGIEKMRQAIAVARNLAENLPETPTPLP